MHTVAIMTATTIAPAAEYRWNPRLWGILVVLCGALFLDALDVSMVGVALPSIRADLGLSTSSLQWVVSGYVLGYGGSLPLGGRAADLLGRRRVFLAALAVFAVASLLGGLVSSGGLLITARLIKGMAAAFTAPAGLSIITTTFTEGPARNRALSIYSAFGAGGFSLRLVLSGLLTEGNWRGTLLLPPPVAAVGLVAPAPRQSRGDGSGRLVRGLPVPGDAVPADHGGLVGAGDRAGVPARGRARRRRINQDGAGAGPVRAPADHRDRLRLPGRWLRVVPPHRASSRLPGGDPARGPADRRRVRARVLLAAHPADRRRRPPAPWPGVGHPADLVPGGRGDSARHRHRGRRRGRGQPRRHVAGPARLPPCARGHHRHLRVRRGDRARRPVRPAEAARRRADRCGGRRGRA